MGDTYLVPSIKESEIQDNAMRPVRVKGKPILLVRKGNKVFGVSNSCPHMGCAFEGGILRDFLIMCPCHGWKFDIRTGKYEENEATMLETYRCIIQNGRIYIEIKNK
ncbi:MAG TPA: Rieske (2Fe-2S) protein [Candidatus Bathyarchaeia archaeon]